ncbi:MAG: hypothetical protein N3F10_03720 [Candidatus Bathyarchaeota archaeon]|nr:hypothetical protein [Candidatus Bathyarchaeota archaeon]MCX8177388.1 hypothetical protein [Candidatus Bathyarchaeota archaeon]MDW8193835.1 hypothetical protein [Nitrososphaerota archaeon]
MPYCPECGGLMLYIASNKQYVCQSCGLSLTQQELVELKEKLKQPYEEEDERTKRRKEYLKWWLSKKK